MGSTNHPAYLNPRHPLFPYLVEIVYPQLGAFPERPRFILRRLAYSPWVYHLTEVGSSVSVVSKGCFLPGSLKHGKLAWLQQEYENLNFLRGIGFDTPPFRVARPLGDQPSLRLGMVQEWEWGQPLDFFLQRAIHQRDESPLFSRLEILAAFLARLHQKTATSHPVDWQPVCAYFHKVLFQLEGEGLLSAERNQELRDLISLWRNRLGDCPTFQVLVHGDATPMNFLFPSETETVALDLERLKPGDRAWDLGMVCGELKHAFLWRRRDRAGAEPFIHHFLEHYVSFFAEPRQLFGLVCRMIPFIMAVTELRIARNHYLDRHYRYYLIDEAAACLSTG